MNTQLKASARETWEMRRSAEVKHTAGAPNLSDSGSSQTFSLEGLLTMWGWARVGPVRTGWLAPGVGVETLDYHDMVGAS